jgi:acyl-CoA hydrolase
MAFEVLNFVDGHNSFLDIYNAVSAEEFYYGQVTMGAVEEVLNKAIKAGAIKLVDQHAVWLRNLSMEVNVCPGHKYMTH